MSDPAPGPGGNSAPSLTFAAAVVYSFMLGAALLWLWGRDRTDLVSRSAGGEVGIVWSAAIGVAVGLAMMGLLVVMLRYLPPCARLRDRLAALLTARLGPISEHQALALALFSAIGEEFFFRLAVQDALGLYWSAVLFGLLHTGPRGLLLWTVLATAVGVGFGWMMELGCGLLSVTVAHALVNYLSLQNYFSSPTEP